MLHRREVLLSLAARPHPPLRSSSSCSLLLRLYLGRCRCGCRHLRLLLLPRRGCRRRCLLQRLLLCCCRCGRCLPLRGSCRHCGLLLRRGCRCRCLPLCSKRYRCFPRRRGLRDRLVLLWRGLLLRKRFGRGGSRLLLRHRFSHVTAPARLGDPAGGSLSPPRGFPLLRHLVPGLFFLALRPGRGCRPPARLPRRISRSLGQNWPPALLLGLLLRWRLRLLVPSLFLLALCPGRGCRPLASLSRRIFRSLRQNGPSAFLLGLLLRWRLLLDFLALRAGVPLLLLCSCVRHLLRPRHGRGLRGCLDHWFLRRDEDRSWPRLGRGLRLHRWPGSDACRADRRRMRADICR